MDLNRHETKRKQKNLKKDVCDEYWTIYLKGPVSMKAKMTTKSKAVLFQYLILLDLYAVKFLIF